MHGSWVVTSATTPLMVLPKTTHFISIDGKDASTHDGIRKTSGLYDRVLKNLTAIRRTNKFPAYIHTVLNTQNYRQIEEILHVWRNNRLADGVIFSIMTRIRNSGCDDDLLLNNSQQKWVIKELLKQKKIFGEFLCMTKKMILMYEPERTRQQKPASCATARFISSFDASGEKIPQCIFSDKGDCSKCGCVITTMIDAITHFPPSPTTIKLLARMYNP